MADPIDLAALHGGWVHVREQDSQVGRVYLRSGTPIPPARGRKSITLQPGGALINGLIGPDDRPLAGAGTWSSEADDTLVLTPDGQPAQRYRIVELTEARLVLAPV
jgi:hypothetical protein